MKGRHDNASKRHGSTSAIPGLLSAIALIVIIIAFGIFLGQREISDKQPDDLAKALCDDAIQVTIKSPSTLQYAERSVYPSGAKGQYRVSGSFDSQNSFGAMIRTEFVCNASVDNQSASLTGLQFNGTPFDDFLITLVSQRVQSKHAHEKMADLRNDQ